MNRSDAGISLHEAIVATTPECVKVLARDGTLLQMNSSGLAMVGARSPEAVLGKCVYDLIAPEHRDAFRAFNERICRGEKGSLEFDIVGLHGSRRHMETHAAPLPQPDGTLAQLAVTRDITERKRSETALRESEQRYRAIVESQTEMVCRFRPDGTILFVNGAYARALGETPEALEGRSFWDFIAESERPAVRAMLDRLTPGAPEVRIENRFETSEGERWTLWTNRALAFDAQGRLLEAQSTGIDITERKRAEEALRASEERYRRLLGLMPAAVYTCEAPAGTITFYNEHAAALWGRAPRIGDTDECFCGSFRLWRPDGSPLPHAETPMAVTLREGREFRNREVIIERPDGSRIHVLVNIDPLRDARGRVVGAINVFHDTTALKQAEEALREADHRKDEFLATLSHELRTPLAPLRNSLQLLRLAGDGDASSAPIREMMERQVNHLVRLVDDLLEMSRISRGAFELRREHVDVAAVIRNAVETSEPLIGTAGHRLVVSLPDRPLWLQGDPVRLAQILANLLNNAAKYTAPGGEVRVWARREADAAVISVRDSGAGIAPDALPGLFRMFSRGDRASRSSQGGLGIGLSLARRLAEMHGGSIEAASEGLGKGAEFTMRLPLCESQQPEPSGEVQSAAALSQKRILVVDDNRDAADSLSMVLKFLGADVRVARDGRQALDEIRTYDPAVVLLDIGMPGMDGYEVARRIRTRFPDRRTAIVALTGWGQENDRRQARDAGFDHHLVKPAEIGALQALLASLDARPSS